MFKQLFAGGAKCRWVKLRSFSFRETAYGKHHCTIRLKHVSKYNAFTVTLLIDILWFTTTNLYYLKLYQKLYWISYLLILQSWSDNIVLLRRYTVDINRRHISSFCSITCKSLEINRGSLSWVRNFQDSVEDRKYVSAWSI